MCDKTKIGYIADSVDPVSLKRLQDKLVEMFGADNIELFELTDAHVEFHPFDTYGQQLSDQFHRLVRNSIRLPFRQAYADRIDRYNRVWPRLGCPMLPWNRKYKWLPRFYDTPRRSYFSQSRLRQSQVMSRPHTFKPFQHTVCSLEDLDLSRWP